MRLDGGVLCLDFVNTIPDRYDGTDRDNLVDFSDLIYWARKAKVIDTARYQWLEKEVARDPRKGMRSFATAIELRSLIYSVFSPLTHGKRIKPADLATFNKLSAHYLSLLRVSESKSGFTEQWDFGEYQLYAITAPIVKSARDLLLSGKLDRLKECPSCGWLFFDSTKNGKRKWCSMEDCGSNAKALDYYYRKKKEKKD